MFIILNCKSNKNRLRSQDIHKIVDVFNKQTEVPKYSRMLPISEIRDEKNDIGLIFPPILLIKIYQGG